jgi:hypothetical protein
VKGEVAKAVVALVAAEWEAAESAVEAMVTGAPEEVGKEAEVMAMVVAAMETAMVAEA